MKSVVPNISVLSYLRCSLQSVVLHPVLTQLNPVGHFSPCSFLRVSLLRGFWPGHFSTKHVESSHFHYSQHSPARLLRLCPNRSEVPSMHLFFTSIAFSSCVCFFQLFDRNVSLEVLGLEVQGPKLQQIVLEEGLEAAEDTPLDLVDLLSETLLEFLVDMVDTVDLVD